MNEIDREAKTTFKEIVERTPMPDAIRDGRDGSILPTYGIWLSEIDKQVTAIFNSSEAQLAALRDERDRVVRVLKVMAVDCEINEWWFHLAERHEGSFSARLFAPDDFDWLRHLIESEEGR